MLVGGRLVAGHRHVVGVRAPDVDAPFPGCCLDLRRLPRHVRKHGVEEGVVHNLDPGRGQSRRHRTGVAVHPAGDGGQTLGAVVARVHGGHHRQQDLGGADVGGSLVPADVLFAGLQRQAVGRRTVGVHRHPDQPSRQLPGMAGVHGEISGVRTAEPHRHAEALSGTERHVGADLTGRGDQGAGQQVGADGDQGAALVGLFHQLRPVGDPAAGARQLGDHPEELPVGKAVVQAGGDDLDAQWFGAGGQHRGGLGEQVGVDGQPVRRPAAGAVHQGHRLGGSGALVEHRRVGDVQSGQIGDHGLEVQQRLQPALADLRLVRRIGGVPGRVLQDVAQQHRWSQRVVIALADHRDGNRVGVGQLSQFGQRLVLAGRCGQRLQSGGDSGVLEGVENARRQRLGGQFVEGVDADDAEHGGQLAGIGADVAGGEIGGIDHFRHS